MTVSRVINNTGRISEATRQRILAIMKEMNYVPNAMARSLVKQESRLLSLLIPDLTNPFYTSLARGAEDAARDLGYRLLLGNGDEDLAKEKEYIETVLSARVDGVLLTPTGDQSLAHLKKLAKQRIPFVLLDREVPGMGSDQILGDSREGTRMLTDHLVTLGHRRIAFLGGSRLVSTARLRLASFEETMAAHGLALPEGYLIEADYRMKEIDRQITALLAMPEPPTALLAANNFLALRAIRALRSLGKRVPDDLSVVCFDELEAGFVVDPFMTVAAQPSYDFGVMGIRMLVDRIQQKAPESWRKVVLPPVLHVRKSSGPPASL
ncbi:LacI family transcriptional regulator [Paenibacillus phyllosphaerae]|uniref:LacI family transcriptional regulator n=2 Tax=Paenibacillus phyllosphaerae TaxID=274593 RepID=A0A7W5AVZ7_9BACL|nr:LacI family transcriptional regulator [Paenibacillus phyllosphaerae]